MRRKPLSDASAAALAETFRALGDLTRVRMLDALARSELCVQDLAASLNLTESAVSHQLRLLRNMRLVRTRRAGGVLGVGTDLSRATRVTAEGRYEAVDATLPALRTQSVGDGSRRPLVFYALDDQHIVGLFEQGLEHVEERDAGVRAKLMPSTSVPAGGTEVAAKAGRRGHGLRSRP